MLFRSFEGKKLSGMELTAFEENLCQTLPTRGIEGKDSYCFLTSIFAFVLLVILQNIILQNNLLDLYLVEIRRHMLSFFTKAATSSVGPFSVFEKSLCEAQNTMGAGTTHIIGLIY